jgi:hypothetical protein
MIDKKFAFNHSKNLTKNGLTHAQLSWVGVSVINFPPLILLSNKIGGNFIDFVWWRNFCAASFDHFHQPCHISAEYLHNLLTLIVLLHLTRYPIYYVTALQLPTESSCRNWEKKVVLDLNSLYTTHQSHAIQR